MGLGITAGLSLYSASFQYWSQGVPRCQVYTYEVLDSTGAYVVSRVPRHVRGFSSTVHTRSMILVSQGAYEDSRAEPCHVRRFSISVRTSSMILESPGHLGSRTSSLEIRFPLQRLLHLRLLGPAGTLLHCAGVLTPEIVSCAGALCFWRRFAFCL